MIVRTIAALLHKVVRKINEKNALSGLFIVGLIRFDVFLKSYLLFGRITKWIVEKTYFYDPELYIMQKQLVEIIYYAPEFNYRICFNLFGVTEQEFHEPNRRRQKLNGKTNRKFNPEEIEF